MNDEWADRQRIEKARREAAGEGRHWSAEEERPRVRSTSRVLRRYQKDRQRLQVLCRSRCVAVVLSEGRPGDLSLAIEAVQKDDSAGAAFYTFDLVEVGNGPVALGCRCGTKHDLDPHKLRAEAWEGQPGRPRHIGVADVVRT
jgi:hypothetical protein